MAVKVVITEAEYRKGEAVFAAAPDFAFVPVSGAEPEVAAAVRREGARYVIVGVQRCTGALYEALPRGGVIARFGVGYDSISLDEVARHGLYCINTPGTLERSVAEFAIGLLLTAARNIAAGSAALKAGAWRAFGGNDLAGKQLLIVGCGAIGRRTARIARDGFGMTILSCGRRPENPDPALFARYSDDFAAVAGEADFVSLHIPDTPATHHYLNRERLALLKPEAIVINTARGAVLNENDLYDAVAAGRIAGAALDVFCEEPYRPADPAKDLRTLPQVVLTPHLGGCTAETCARVAASLLGDLRLAEAGKPENMHLVNRS